MAANRQFSSLGLVISLVVATSHSVVADVYCVELLSDLKVLEKTEPKQPDASQKSNVSYWWLRSVAQPYAVLEGEGEIVVTSTGNPWQGDPAEHLSVAVRVPGGRKVIGKVFVPTRDYRGMTISKIQIDPDNLKEEDRREFFQAKLKHYHQLASHNWPGTAWFRYQARKVQSELGLPNESIVRNRNRLGRRTSLESTYGLISGGRAVSENLQLERILPESSIKENSVKLDSIKGITIKEFDWNALLQKGKPARDPLAIMIPDNQYAIFLPSFSALIDLVDQAGEQGTPILRAADTRAEDAQVRQRYEKQLGLEMSALARRLGPTVIKSVAITGADPYLRTGADLAILFEAHDVDTLCNLLEKLVATSVAGQSQVETTEGIIEGVSYRGFRSADRAVCSYIAQLKDAVVVTNSPAQLARLAQVAQGKLPSINELDEYSFFRQRYSIDAKDQTALLVLSDKTIRKWCGPRWRIASSRRMRAASVMSELQATYMDQLVEGNIEKGPLHSDWAAPDLGDLSLGPQGVQSSVYGTLEFLTPILELDFQSVTAEEAEFYRRWREGYERNWSNFFDPIAIQFKASPEQTAIDLTVMPLIEFSDYRQLVSISRGAALDELSGDPHPESILHAVLALNLESELLSRQANMAQTIAKVNPMSWIGESAAFYVDEDPLWNEFGKLTDEDQIREFFQSNVHRLPVALNFEVNSSLKLIVFLTGLRTYIDQIAPGMTTWETLKHHEQPYVKITPAQSSAAGNNWDQVALYYVASGEAFVISLNENLIKRAIDRKLQRSEKNATVEKPGKSNILPWLGENFCVTIKDTGLKLLDCFLGTWYQREMQRLAWSNLPILNEWHARFPGRDPVEIHEQIWHRKLTSPAGGKYQWNEQWQTMESTVYGHPGEPRLGASLPKSLQALTSANFGQTFEENGLRVRAELGISK